MLKILQSHSQCHQHHQIAVPAFARWCCQWWSYSYLQWEVCTTWRWKSQCPPCHRWAPIPRSSATASRYLTVMGASSFNDRFFPGTRTPACRSLSCNKKHTEHNYWRHVLMLVHDSIHIVYGYISCVYLFIYLDISLCPNTNIQKLQKSATFQLNIQGLLDGFWDLLLQLVIDCRGAQQLHRPVTATTCDTKTKWSVIRAATCTHIDIAYLLPIYILIYIKLHTHITYLIHRYT